MPQLPDIYSAYLLDIDRNPSRTTYNSADIIIMMSDCHVSLHEGGF